MLPMLVSSAQRLPWPSCSMPKLVRKGGVKTGSRGIYTASPHAVEGCVPAPAEKPPCKERGSNAPVPLPVTYTWPVSWATTNAEEKPSSWLRVQLRSGWHIPVTGA